MSTLQINGEKINMLQFSFKVISCKKKIYFTLKLLKNKKKLSVLTLYTLFWTKLFIKLIRFCKKILPVSVQTESYKITFLFNYPQHTGQNAPFTTSPAGMGGLTIPAPPHRRQSIFFLESPHFPVLLIREPIKNFQWWHIFYVCILFNTASSVAPQIQMLGSNPGQLWLRHWLSRGSISSEM
jgi:hypothetical protein